MEPQDKQNPWSQSIRFYDFLSNLPLIQGSFRAKIFLIAFLGNHIPLLALIYYILFHSKKNLLDILPLLLVALGATVIGTLFSLILLSQLLRPIRYTSRALKNYVSEKGSASLPTHYKDEIGSLMLNTHNTLHRLDEMIQFISNFDEMTGLPNRGHFMRSLSEILNAKSKEKQKGALLIISLQNFPSIHLSELTESADHLLKSFAQKIIFLTPVGTLIGSLERTKFAVFLPDYDSKDSIIRMAETLLRELQEPFTMVAQANPFEVSVGISLWPDDSQSSGELLQKAESALLTANASEGSNYVFYNSDKQNQTLTRMKTELDIDRALENNEFFLVFQPRIDLKSQKISGAEALIRWNHPDRGEISPADFIEIAETSHRIHKIGQWVLNEAIKSAAEIQEIFPSLSFKLSMNLSAKQIQDPNLPLSLKNALQLYEMNSNTCEVEITESSFLYDIQKAITILNEIKGLGFTLAIDDFGTGYSSLSYLSKLPVELIKIDKSFVQEVKNGKKESTLISAILSMTKNLGLRSTAEGVESREQYEYLRNLGCDEIQGFYVSKPLRKKDFLELLRNPDSIYEKLK